MEQKPIKAVLDANFDRLMSIPGVLGTGEGRERGVACVKVFVISKNAGLMKRLPKELDGYEVVVEETGEIEARGAS